MRMTRFLAFLLCLLLPLSAVAEELFMFCDQWDSEMNPRFAEDYPDIIVRTNWDTNELADAVNFDQVLVDLVSRNYVYDLFNLKFASDRPRRLSDRLFLVDLRQSDVIRKAVAQMPEAIQQRVTNDKGDIFALPHSMYAVGDLYGFNTEVAAQLGIEKPQTWAELLQLFEDWDYDYADDAEDLGLYLSDQTSLVYPERVLMNMMNAYIADHADGRAISYATPEFTALMQTYAEHRQMLADLYEKLSMPTIASAWERSLFVSSCPLLMDYDTEEWYDGRVEPLTLSITDDPADAVIPVDMAVVSVCAGAPHAELAMTYAEDMVPSMRTENRILFQGGSDDTPVESDNYASIRAYYVTTIATLEAAIQEEGETPELMELMEQYKHEQADNEQRRYEYTSESIRQYAALAPFLRPMPSISFDYYMSQQNTQHILYGFVQGDTPVEQFIREFDHVQSMMNLEEQ